MLIITQEILAEIKAAFEQISAADDLDKAREICATAIAQIEAISIEIDTNGESFQTMVSCLLDLDIFNDDGIGNWAAGIEWDTALGWLIQEREKGAPEDEALATQAWRTGQPLPSGWHRLSREVATQAVVIGMRTHGHSNFLWASEGSDRDHALQSVLFGKQIYD